MINKFLFNFFTSFFGLDVKTKAYDDYNYDIVSTLGKLNFKPEQVEKQCERIRIKSKTLDMYMQTETDEKNAPTLEVNYIKETKILNEQGEYHRKNCLKTLKSYEQICQVDAHWTCK